MTLRWASSTVDPWENSREEKEQRHNILDRPPPE